MTTKLIDSHCHFDFPPFKDNELFYLEKARSVGVKKLIIPSVNSSNWETVERLSHQYPELYYALGIHPQFLTENDEDDVKKLEVLLANKANKANKCVAIGECGLDFWNQEYDKKHQMNVFKMQCKLAVKYGLPLIIHSRKSHDVVLKILREIKPLKGGVIHGFSGSTQQAEAFIKLGFFIGVGGVISYDRSMKTKRTISELPLEWLMLETDAPDMPLSGFQGTPNSPDKVSNILECLILIRKEPRETIANAVYRNANHLFGI